MKYAVLVKAKEEDSSATEVPEGRIKSFLWYRRNWSQSLATIQKMVIKE